jgi:hypothetical protein
VIGEIASNCREELVCLSFGPFPSPKSKVRAEIRLLEYTCDFMCNRRLSSACLAEDDEGTFRCGIFDPLEDVVEKILACAFETAFLIAKWPASRVR